MTLGCLSRAPGLGLKPALALELCNPGSYLTSLFSYCTWDSCRLLSPSPSFSMSECV